jgi:hypothetical protein
LIIKESGEFNEGAFSMRRITNKDGKVIITTNEEPSEEHLAKESKMITTHDEPAAAEEAKRKPMTGKGDSR